MSKCNCFSVYILFNQEINQIILPFLEVKRRLDQSSFYFVGGKFDTSLAQCKHTARDKPRVCMFEYHMSYQLKMFFIWQKYYKITVLQF